MTKAGVSVSYGLDVSGRTKTMTRSGVTSTYKYAGDGDTADWVVDGSTTTRYVGGAGGLSAVQVIGGATTWILPAPHGEVWAHTDSSGAATATFLYMTSLEWRRMPRPGRRIWSSAQFGVASPARPVWFMS